ncbi:hypothetical protein HPB48_023989 [Haemaphysalis longicornis]|uniref:Transposable element P transposase-like RNase H domain-containing protein n=1 Tax=Haemaphysalis longicornis TaxID=44386 RepID=A0A9J6H667_HAELO|nr:hypothetical protein HPB48_023989 [Haemaphysalis longicornis]
MQRKQHMFLCCKACYHLTRTLCTYFQFAQIGAKQLHDFLDLLIRKLEDIGIRVVAVVSDNNSINRKAMSFFADPPKLSIVYRHPLGLIKALVLYPGHCAYPKMHPK